MSRAAKAPAFRRAATFLVSGPGWLWTLLLIYAVLVGGTLLGIHWPLKPGVAFGRLLTHGWAAGIEAMLALSMLGLARFGRSRPWLINTVAVASAVVGFGHMWYYLIGTEFLLIWGALRVAGEYGRSRRA